MTEIQRQVHYIVAQIFDPEDSSGANNNWQYNRAPPGYLFQLHSVNISTDVDNSRNSGIFAIFDGHEYTHWNIWTGVQSNETLWRAETSTYQIDLTGYLNNWPCKEYTIGCRSNSETKQVKYCAIVWYYLKKASRMELMEYAIKHPKNQDMFKRVYRGTTVEPSEANG